MSKNYLLPNSLPVRLYNATAFHTELSLLGETQNSLFTFASANVTFKFLTNL